MDEDIFRPLLHTYASHEVTRQWMVEELEALGYEVLPPTNTRPSFTCPVCQMTSYNPTDVFLGYCGKCHDWTGPKDRSSVPSTRNEDTASDTQSD